MSGLYTVPTATCAPGLHKPASRRHVLQMGGLGAALLGALLLGGCSVAPSRTADKRSARRSRPRELPQAKVLRPLKLSPALRKAVVAHAMSAVNTAYRYGGTTLAEGLDCSGLVHYAFSRASTQPLPRSTMQWAQTSLPIDEEALQVGDLVFFNTLSVPFSHMGIYVGARQFVHAPSSGKRVRVDSLDHTYYADRFNGARTVFAG